MIFFFFLVIDFQDFSACHNLCTFYKSQPLQSLLMKTNLFHILRKVLWCLVSAGSFPVLVVGRVHRWMQPQNSVHLQSSDCSFHINFNKFFFVLILGFHFGRMAQWHDGSMTCSEKPYQFLTVFCVRFRMGIKKLTTFVQSVSIHRRMLPTTRCRISFLPVYYSGT